MKPQDAMAEALIEAQKAYTQDEVPVGCVIIYKNEIIASAHNLKETDRKACAHAEVLAITQANHKLNSWRLDNCTLVVTLEPCMMCAGAIAQARIPYVIFGASDTKFGAYGGNFDSQLIRGLNHYPKIMSGICEEETKKILQDFFKNKRKTKQ